jgi:Barstar (barnase inhibitor)
MAPFTQLDEHEQRLDRTILRDGSIALYWRCEFFDEDTHWLRQQSYRVFSFDCERWASSEEVHADFQTTLSLPAYYGKNLDALNDCMDDLAVPDVGGIAIALSRFDAYAKGQGAAPIASGRLESEIALDILARASRFFLLTGRRMLTLVQTDDPRIQFDSLSCVGAVWNWREWLNKNRGL